MIRMKTVTYAALLTAALALGACSSAPMTEGTRSMMTPMSGAGEVPPVAGMGSGMAEVSYNPATYTLRWTVTYSGLSGPVSAGHFHGPAAASTNAPVVVPFTGSMASPITGSAVLTPAQASDFVAGKWYVNLHTAANPGGEIRGQVAAAH